MRIERRAIGRLPGLLELRLDALPDDRLPLLTQTDLLVVPAEHVDLADRPDRDAAQPMDVREDALLRPALDARHSVERISACGDPREPSLGADLTRRRGPNPSKRRQRRKR